MHETNENTPAEFDAKSIADKLELVIERLGVLNETAMAAFVQLSRLYDILAADFYAKYEDSAEGLLDMHEEGYINSTAPVLKGFGQEKEPVDESN